MRGNGGREGTHEMIPCVVEVSKGITDDDTSTDRMLGVDLRCGAGSVCENGVSQIIWEVEQRMDLDENVAAILIIILQSRADRAS